MSGVGSQAGEVRISWPGSAPISHRVNWTIAPLIRVDPPALMIPGDPQPGDYQHRFLISGQRRPITIKAVRGGSVVGNFFAEQRSGSQQEVVVRIDVPAEVATVPTRRVVTFLTDSTVQPEVSCPILLMPGPVKGVDDHAAR